MTRLLVIPLALALVGCAHRAPAPAAPELSAPPAPAPRPLVYTKPGATHEEFLRTKARCLAQAETAKAASTEESWARVGTWIVVYRNCMRADGWALVPGR